MSSRAILVDLCLAVAVAVALLILTPGLAIVALIAIFTLVVCVASFAIDWAVRRRRRRSQTARGH